MARKAIIERAQRRADTKGTKINAAEVSRVASLVLDDVDHEMQELFVGIYWDFHKVGGEPAANKVIKLCRKLEAIVQRAMRKHGSKRRGK